MNPSQSFRFNHHQSIVVVSKIQYTIFSTQKGKLPKIMTMISYTKSTAYGAPSCRPLTSVRVKTNSAWRREFHAVEIRNSPRRELPSYWQGKQKTGVFYQRIGASSLRRGLPQ